MHLQYDQRYSKHCHSSHLIQSFSLLLHLELLSYKAVKMYINFTASGKNRLVLTTNIYMIITRHSNYSIYSKYARLKLEWVKILVCIAVLPNTILHTPYLAVLQDSSYSQNNYSNYLIILHSILRFWFFPSLSMYFNSVYLINFYLTSSYLNKLELCQYDIKSPCNSKI